MGRGSLLLFSLAASLDGLRTNSQGGIVYTTSAETSYTCTSTQRGFTSDSNLEGWRGRSMGSCARYSIGIVGVAGHTDVISWHRYSLSITKRLNTDKGPHVQSPCFGSPNARVCSALAHLTLHYVIKPCVFASAGVFGNDSTVVNSTHKVWWACPESIRKRLIDRRESLA